MLQTSWHPLKIFDIHQNLCKFYQFGLDSIVKGNCKPPSNLAEKKEQLNTKSLLYIQYNC
jgi:hypothetical protein